MTSFCVLAFAILFQSSEKDLLRVVKDRGGSINYDEGKPGGPFLKLDLKRTFLDNDDLRKISDLTEKIVELDIGYTPISDQGLAHLCKQRHLRTLKLTATKTTKNGLVHLKELTSLQVLLLIGTKVSGGLANIEDLTELQQLDLLDTGLEDQDLAHLGRLRDCFKTPFMLKRWVWKGHHTQPISRMSNGSSSNLCCRRPSRAGDHEKPICVRFSMPCFM